MHQVQRLRIHIVENVVINLFSQKVKYEIAEQRVCNFSRMSVYGRAGATRASQAQLWK